jgi:hypothetical protein
VRAGTKLGAYALVLAAALGGGAALGGAVGPIDTSSPPAHDTHAGGDTVPSDLPAGGLLVANDGYHLEPEDRNADPGAFSFTIVGPDGEPVTAYDTLHDRELHLIVASRDLRRYAHLHPKRDADGRWTAQLPAFPPGAYRAFADFDPAGGAHQTLGVDLVEPGPAGPLTLLEPRMTDDVDGYQVTLVDDHGELTVTVRHDGRVLTTEPYLGAAGHLVALREGDLAYLHVHPLDDEPSGPVRFAVEVPAAGTYALFFDFKLEGAVRTARFVIDAPAGAPHGS